MSAPATAIATTPESGTKSRPTRRLAASATTPTSSGAPKKPTRISHVTTVSPVPGRMPGNWSAPCTAAGIRVATPRPAAANPAIVPGTLGKASAAAIPAAVEHYAEAGSLALYATGRVADDGIIDPRDTRTVIAMALSACHSGPVQGARGYGVFRL